ncbi:hypothetical protein [Solibacillus isronensis]|uniref:hypothetical protein n=1 Tax=Solibacillus isronensis TaxID=412383 RepID=UPI0009A57244|nr:hypothetical protein [Solibacillus isronensis]
MVFQHQGTAMFNVLIVGTAACIAPMPVVQADYSVDLGLYKHLSDEKSESSMVYGTWVECEKIIPSFKTKNIEKIEVKSISLNEEIIIFNDDYEGSVINSDFNKIGLDIVEEANLKSIDEEILFFDEGPIEIIEDEDSINRGTSAFPKDYRYLS